jgi:long-subunit acyl-CoA synthetase (AMP-forming)
MRTTLEIVRYYAARGTERVALRAADGTSLTYKELLAAATRISRTISGYRLRVLAIALDNGPEWIASDLAAQMARIPLVPLPPFFSTEQLRHVLTDSGADGVIVDKRVLERQGVALSLETLACISRDLRLARVACTDAVQRVPSGTAKVSYTSGSTGQPKGVCLTQGAMDAVAQSLWAATASLELTKHLCLLPLPTLLENVAGVYAPLRGGAEICAPPLAEIGFNGATAIDTPRFLGCLAAYAPESIILLPQTLLALVTAIENGAPRPPSLRFAAVGGGFVSKALLERADRLGLPVYEGYGLTECASVVALNTPNARRIGSVGRPLRHAAVRIARSSEIFVSGQAACGYLGKDREPLETATGDLGHMDSDGFLYIDGRRKNMFITSVGRNVSPEWVESELVCGPEIAQAAVFGEARPWNVAVIVPTKPSAAGAEIQAAIDRINSGLPDYARVGMWVRADAPFTPANGLMTPNGRNRRAAIHEHYRSRIDACYDDELRDFA